MEDAFWDSSSLVPLCTVQRSTQAALALRNQFRISVWWATPVEVRGAIARMTRAGEITANGEVRALIKLDELRRNWTEIDPHDEVRNRAELVVERHQLRSADAMQLAAALVWCNGHPRRRAFISGDAQLLAAAEMAGFRAIEC